MINDPDAPILSATVLLLRDSGQLEVLLVKRHSDIAFAGNALVFPGGKASDDDRRPAWRDHMDEAGPKAHLVAKIAAIREAFEEAGVLLARPRAARGAGAPLVGPDVVEMLDPFRNAIDRGEQSFLELIKAHGLVLALDTLVHFGHWITPVMMPKRFDTHFYIAPMPAEQTARQDGRETTEAIFLSPHAALELEAAGKAKIIFPTRMNLGKLAEAGSVSEALARFSGRKVFTVTPEVFEDEDGETCLRIPVAAGYIQTTEPLEKIASGVGLGAKSGE